MSDPAKILDCEKRNEPSKRAGKEDEGITEATEATSSVNERMIEFIAKIAESKKLLQEIEDESKVLDENITSLEAENTKLTVLKAWEELNLGKLNEILDLFVMEEELFRRKKLFAKNHPEIFNDLNYDLEQFTRNLQGRHKFPSQHQRYCELIIQNSEGSNKKTSRQISDKEFGLRKVDREIAENKEKIEGIKNKIESNINKLKSLTEKSPENGSCPICFEEYDDVNQIKCCLSSCGHQFCKKCLYVILENPQLCPTCINPFEASNIIQLF
jgi:hypothetical protein